MLNDSYRTTELSSVRSRQDSTPNKPVGLSAPTKAAVIHLTTTATDEDEEPNALTEEEEVADDLEYSAGSKDSLVWPPISLAYVVLTRLAHRSASHP